MGYLLRKIGLQKIKKLEKFFKKVILRKLNKKSLKS